MVPSPGWKAMRGWEPKVSSVGLWSQKVSGLRAQVSRRGGGRERRQQPCSQAPSPQPRSPRSRLPPRKREEVTVPGANTEELPAHPASASGNRAVSGGGEGKGAERAAGAAPAGPGPSPASPRARRKVSSQSPRHPLAQPTAEHNCLAASESGPRRPATAPGP